MQAYEEIFAIGRAHPALDLETALNLAAIVAAEAEIPVPQHEVGDNADDTFGEVFSPEFTLSDDFQPLESVI